MREIQRVDGSAGPIGDDEVGGSPGATSDGFQLLQIHVALLARKTDFLSAAALVLVNAGNAMVSGVVHLHLSVAKIDREASLIAEESIAGLVLTAG